MINGDEVQEAWDPLLEANPRIDRATQIGTATVMLASEDIERLKVAIEEAKTIEDVERLESALRTGIIPEELMTDGVPPPDLAEQADLTSQPGRGSGTKQAGLTFTARPPGWRRWHKIRHNRRLRRRLHHRLPRQSRRRRRPPRG